MDKYRAFIAIDIPCFPKLVEIEKELKDTGADIKLVEPENIHITLKFLGDISTDISQEIKKIIEESVKNYKAFEIKLSNIGVFPSKEYIKIIWIGIQDTDTLKNIAENIDKKINQIGFKREKRPFSAHLTIGRVKNAKNKEKIIQIINKYQNVDFFKLKVKEIILKKSTLTPKGPIYSDIEKIKI